MSNGGPARDGAFSANQAKLGIFDRLTAGDIAAGGINVSQLWVQGVPIRDYVCSLISDCGFEEPVQVPEEKSEFKLSIENSLILPKSEPESEPKPEPIPKAQPEEEQPSPPIVLRSLPPPVVEFAQVASRAAHAHVADIAHGYHDPVNGHKGYVLTADEYGQGSWQILPESAAGDVEGPLQSRIDSLAVFDTTNGRLLRDCKVTVQDDVLHAASIETERLLLRQNNVPPGTVAVKGAGGELLYDTNLTRTLNEVILQIRNRPALVVPPLPPPPPPTPTPSPAPPPQPQVFKAPRDTLPFSTPITAYNGDIQWTRIHSVLMPWKSDEEWTNAVPIHYKGNLVPSQVTIENASDLHSQAIHAKAGILQTITSGEIMADEITVQNLSVVELHIPEGAQNHYILTSNADGKCVWTAPTALPDNIVTANVNDEHSPGRFSLVKSSDQKCLKISGSALQVDEDGTLFAHTIQFATPDSALRTSNNDILLHQTQDGICLLGTQAHTLVGGAGAMQHASSLVKHVVAWGAESVQYAEVDEIVGIGYKALARLKTGQGNVAVGPHALSENETGHFCTAVGHNCLAKSKSSANTGYGAGCLGGLEDGWHNTGFGTGAGEFLMHGSNNTMVGDGAGPSGDFQNTISLGRNASAGCDGDFALGSRDAPLRVTQTATSGDLTGLNPTGYLNVTLNGAPYKIALFLP
jgi:hypothetical protein